MAGIWEKAISIFAGNLNSGCGYLITAVLVLLKYVKARGLFVAKMGLFGQ